MRSSSASVIETNCPFPQVRGSNYCDLGWRVDDRTRRVIVISVIDNLTRGASGQAVCNMNIMRGLRGGCWARGGALAALRLGMNEHGPEIERNIKLVLEYDGSGYHGWQRQAGALSIQEVIESRLGVMLGKRVGIRASGRTDAGVHAKGQVVNFHTRTRLTPDEVLKGLNSLLPGDIVVLSAAGSGRVLSMHAFQP